MFTLAKRLNATYWLSTTLLFLMVCSAGCERRTHYRRQADRAASSLVSQGGNDPRWELGGVNVYMDPRSRYFDEYNIDKPPMPEDDPASHQYMLCVDGMKGYRKWNQNGFRSNLANSQWMEQLRDYVEVSAENEVVLNTDSALRLAQVNSPDYQQQLETLYLSALDVSTERFRLQTQFYNGMDLIFDRRGEGRGGEQNNLRVLPDSQFTRQFATAGTLLIGFANSFVWQFTGNDSNNAFSLINFNLVQPLLRGGGRVIGLERLTLVERSLLGNLRAFQRYRQGFYTDIAIGQSTGGLQRRGGFAGGTGLTGFTGTGQGGFGGVGAATGFGGFGSGGGGGSGGAAIGTGLAGGGAGTVGGFIGLLQRLQELRNAKDSLDLQLRTLSLLEGNLEAGLIDLAQVDQFRQSIETQRAQLLQAQNALQTSIDTYLTGTLGLPPNLPVRLDDEFIQPFQLIDPQMTVFQNAVYAVQDAIGATADDPSIEINAENVGGFIAAGSLVRQEMTGYFEKIRADFQKAQQVADARMQLMSEKERNTFLAEQKQLQETLDALEERLLATAQTLQGLESGLNDENAEERLNELIIWLREFLGLHQEVSLAQARARLEAVSLEPIHLQSTQALTIAKWNRLDLMNNRAALVDNWRLIAFNANALNADLDFTVRGDWQTTGNNILKFEGDNSFMAVGARFDSPFTRLLERNNYRQSLIDYQQARRQLIQFEDGINATLRNLLRQLDQLETNLEIQRRAVAISIRRVDFTQAELNRPLPVPAPGQPQPSFGPTAVQNLSSALADLRNSQNNFMSVWLNYYTTRMTLMRELGIMQLDDQGRWLDDKFHVADYICEEAMEELPEVPRSWIEKAFEGASIPQAAEEQAVPLAE